MEQHNTIGEAKKELKEMYGTTAGYGYEVAYDTDWEGKEVIDIYLHATDYKGRSVDEGVTLRTYPISEESKALAYAKRLAGNYTKLGE